MHSFALQLARAPNGLSLLAGFPFRRFLVKFSALHLAKSAFALHFLFQRTQGLLDIIVAYQYLNDGLSLLLPCSGASAGENLYQWGRHVS